MKVYLLYHGDYTFLGVLTNKKKVEILAQRLAADIHEFELDALDEQTLKSIKKAQNETIEFKEIQKKMKDFFNEKSISWNSGKNETIEFKEIQKKIISGPSRIAKGLKLWNGRGTGKYSSNDHFYIAAKSVKQASDLLLKVSGGYVKSLAYEINEYYSKNCWGNAMTGIPADEPCVYLIRGGFGEEPERLI